MSTVRLHLRIRRPDERSFAERREALLIGRGGCVKRFNPLRRGSQMKAGGCSGAMWLGFHYPHEARMDVVVRNGPRTRMGARP